MSRRTRALAFALLAVVAAVVAAALANGYRTSIARRYGSLRQVVVVRQLLPARRPIGPGALQSALEVRRVPARFVPPGTLVRPSQALGREPAAPIPPGSYLSASALRRPVEGSPAPRLADRQRPVAIRVSGASGLMLDGSAGARGGERVDVVVTTEPTGAGPGRTYVEAAAVPLLALEPVGAGGMTTATLGLSRGKALDLIAAQNFAREVTLLPSRPD